MKIFERSILRRLLCVQFLVLFLFMGSQLWLTYRAVMQFGTGDFDREMMFAAEALAKLGEPDLDDPQELQDTARTFEHLSIEVAAQFGMLSSYQAVLQLWSASGELLFRTDAAPTTLLAQLKPGVAETTIGDREWRVATARGPTGRLYAQVAESSEMRREAMVHLVQSYFLQPFAWLTLLLLTLTWIAAVQGLRPLSALARQIKLRSATDLSRISAQPAYAETQTVASAINELIERIENTLAHERNFLADAAHELRTPLAALQAQLHVLLHARTVEERGAAEEDMRRAMARAATLLKQLLASARLESDASSLARERLDLAVVVQERVAAFGRAAIDKSIDLELDSPVACDALVDRDVIVSLIDNLIDNAVRYVPDGGRIHVALSGTDETVTLRVADDGPGIPVAEHERIFERFRRLPGNDEPGSGLGLAIARRAVLLHGGRIVLGNGNGIGGGGLSVEVVLPRYAHAGQPSA